MDENDSRKRALGDDDNSGEAPKRSRGSEPLVKMLVASPHCGHVLGKGGSYVKELRNTYGGHVGFSGTDQFFPGTSERICLITGTIEQVTDLSCQVLERLSKHEDRKTRLLVTALGAGMILGKGGSTIKQIQEKTGVKMVIEGSGGEGLNERAVTISGTLQQRIDTVKEIIDRVANEPTNMANTNLKYDSRGPVDPRPLERRPNLGGTLGGGRAPQFPPMGLPVGLPLNTGKRPRLNVLPSTVELTIDVPRSMVGYIMGKGGQGIKEMTRSSKGAKFRFDEYAPPADEEGSRKLSVTGNLEQVTIAYDLVHDKVDEYTNYQQQFRQNQSQRIM